MVLREVQGSLVDWLVVERNEEVSAGSTFCW
jgi:hypothetical protein